MKQFVGMAAIVLLASCTTTAPSCPAPGTFVPFGKVMNEAYAPTYAGCTITTTATFVGTGNGGIGLGYGREDNHTIIRTIAPGEAMPSGLQFPRYVALPKNGSDLAYELKQGEPITLRGGTLPRDTFLHPITMFLASSIERTK